MKMTRVYRALGKPARKFNPFPVKKTANSTEVKLAVPTLALQKTVQKPVRTYSNAEKENFNNYLRIVESIHASESQFGVQVVGITGISKHQKTAKMASAISSLVSVQTNESIDGTETAQDDMKRAFADLSASQKTLRISDSIKHYAPAKKNHVDSSGGFSVSQNSLQVSESIARFETSQTEVNGALKNYTFTQSSLRFSEQIENGSPAVDRVSKALVPRQRAKIDKPRKQGVFLIDEHWDVIEPHLEKLRAKKRFIFIDIPPVLHHPKSIQMCKLCDTVIMVIEANRTRREIITEAKKTLEGAGVKILGGVLTSRKFHLPDWLYHRL